MVDYSKFDHIGSSDDEEGGSRPGTKGSGPAAAAEAAANKSSAPQQPPVADDSRSEIEKLKAAKRAQRQAREAAEAATGGPQAEEKPDTAPPPPKEDAPPAESEPLALLRQAEAIQAKIKETIAEVEGSLSHSEKVELQVISSINGMVGKLQGVIDTVSVGDLEEGAERDGARARRKALNAFAEGVMPEIQAVRAKVIAANKK